VLAAPIARAVEIDRDGVDATTFHRPDGEHRPAGADAVTDSGKPSERAEDEPAERRANVVRDR
jgi:hypothetical protein